MLDPGAVGSPLDAATLAVVLGKVVHDFDPRLRAASAALVALARGRRVNADRLQADLDVDDQAVDATTVVACGGTEGDHAG